jgi:hypothetical protein
MDRTGRRKLLKAVDGFAAALPGSGFVLPAPPAQVAGLARRLHRILSRREDATRASKAAAFAGAAFDATVPRMPILAKVECRPGCAFCCKSMVATPAPFVFAISRRSGGAWPMRRH